MADPDFADLQQLFDTPPRLEDGEAFANRVDRRIDRALLSRAAVYGFAALTGALVALSQLARPNIPEALQRLGTAVGAGVDEGLSQAAAALDPQTILWTAVLAATSVYVAHVLREN